MLSHPTNGTVGILCILGGSGGEERRTTEVECRLLLRAPRSREKRLTIYLLKEVIAAVNSHDQYATGQMRSPYCLAIAVRAKINVKPVVMRTRTEEEDCHGTVLANVVCWTCLTLIIQPIV
jgi:hypothetical protein